jgi:hypothetical protein
MRLAGHIAYESALRGACLGAGGMTAKAEQHGEKRAEAMLALSQHLLAVPMGEPAVWGAKVNGQWFNYSRSREALVEEIEERLSTTADVVVPLFTKPEGMA